jgi:aspartokinase-like uncharacterized kinase
VTAIVKLGGSLAAAGTLRQWLAVVERAGGRCVVVPGGGPFANAIRAAQKPLGFSDTAAHQMALLAMHQTALMLADLAPRLRPCDSETAMADALGAGAVPVWVPTAMVMADPSVAESWDVTSDSLAAWLASRLDADRLVLVKSAPPPLPPVTPTRLAAAGLVDAAFPAYAAGVRWDLRCRGPGQQEGLAADLGLPAVAHGAAAS